MLIVGVVLLLAPAQAGAATLPSGFEERVLASGLQGPVAVDWTPDGRMLVAEKDGRVKVVPPGTTTATQVLDISDRVNAANDRGLLGLAVDADFAANRFIYLLYTRELSPLVPDSEGEAVSQLVRVVLNPDNSIGAQTVILGSHTSGPCPQPSNTVDCVPSEGPSHSIGTVLAAPDGTLFVGSGDAASYAFVDPLAFRTYDERSLAGKILHIDRDGRGLPGHPFCTADGDLTHVCTKLHAKGFRNPFRFTRRPNGGLVVGDVGWNEREEIDLIAASGGRSYGWPCYEGAQHTPGYRDRSECPPEYAKEGGPNAHLLPALDYTRGLGGTVIGGPEYAGDEYPAGYRGSIFFGDFLSATIKRLTLDSGGAVSGTQTFATGWTGGVNLKQAPDGNLAYVEIGSFDNDGQVKKVVYSPGNRAPVAAATATPTSGAAPLRVDFDGSASSDPDNDPLSYDWDFGDGSAHSSDARPRHVYDQGGTFTARLTVSDGRGRTDSKTITITPGGDAPVPTIATPAGESLYRDGNTVNLSGSATDVQDGSLPASALSWRVLLHHGDHVHPVNEFAGVAQTSFVARRDHDADSHYEIVLTARDSTGLTGSKSIRIRPETVDVRIDSTPDGAAVSYGGRGATAPYKQSTAIGYDTTVTAEAGFRSNDRSFYFDSWSDGGERVHNVRVPASDFTLRAIYKEDKAEQRVASASSSESASLGPGKAVDNDSGTRWSSSFGDEQYWQVDLGRSRAIDRVELNWEYAYASRYRILTSADGTNFTEVVEETADGPGWRATPFAQRNARYVRVLGVTRGTPYGISLWDARVLGPADTVDDSPPETTITDGPTGTVTSGSVSYTFSSEAGATFECRLDGGGWSPCSSPYSASDVPAGAHMFEVRATDQSGSVDPSPAQRSFTVDYGEDKARGRAATASSSEGAGYVPGNAVDGDAATRWSSTFGDNQWWQVDLGSRRRVDRVQLDWEAAYASSYRILASLDGTNWTTVTDATASRPGPKVTSFAARDARYVRVLALQRATQYGISLWDSRVFGPADVPADTTPPQTTLDSGPSGTVTSTSASFTFSSEPGATFECRLDGGSWGGCTSPKAYSALGAGSHTFEVRATDAAGNTDPTPATRTWTVSTSSASYRSTVLGTAGLFGYYRLGDPGTTAADSKGTAPGAYVNGPASFPTLVTGGDGSHDFDGTNDYVNLDPGPFGTPGSFSVEAWVRLDTRKASGAYHVLVSDAANDLFDGFSLVVNGSNAPQFVVARSSSVKGTATGPALTLGKTAHIVGVYTGTQVRLYVDGVRRSTVGYSNVITWSAGRDLVLAAEGAASKRANRFLDGKLDEVALYRSALSDADVLAHYNAGK